MGMTGQVEATGNSLDEAVKAAVEKVPSQSGADILVILTVETWGFKSGGFAGVNEYWVKASYRFG